MKTSLKKFLVIFVIAAFAFQFITQSLLGPDMRGFPNGGTFFPGADSPTPWKRAVATIIYPIKFVLLRPLSNTFNDPDPVPPIRAAAFAIYWALLGLIFYYLCNAIIAVTRKRTQS